MSCRPLSALFLIGAACIFSMPAQAFAIILVQSVNLPQRQYNTVTITLHQSSFTMVVNGASQSINYDVNMTPLPNVSVALRLQVVGGGAGNSITFYGQSEAISHVEFIGGISADTVVNNAAERLRAFGGDGDDVIDGGELGDYLDGGPGDDLIRGHGGSDTIYGGDGDDELRGQAGSDMILGDHGVDWVIGGGEGDRLFGCNLEEYDGLPDLLEGHAGCDTFHAENYVRIPIYLPLSGVYKWVDVVVEQEVLVDFGGCDMYYAQQVDF